MTSTSTWTSWTRRTRGTTPTTRRTGKVCASEIPAACASVALHQKQLCLFLFGPVPEVSAPARSGTGEPDDPIPTYSAEEERRDVKLWRTVIIGEQEHRINMKVIEPYMRVISHGGGEAASNAGCQEKKTLQNEANAKNLLLCVLPRLLRQRSERHHCVCGLFPA